MVSDRASRLLADHCRATGRDVNTIRKAVHLVLGIARDRRRAEAKAVDAFVRFGIPAEEAGQAAIIGTSDECVGVVRQYGALGIDRFVIEMRPPYDYEALELFATEVVPAFR